MLQRRSPSCSMPKDKSSARGGSVHLDVMQHTVLMKQAVIHISILIIVIGGLYSNVLQAGFIYDDHAFIVNNPQIKSLQPVTRFFTQPFIFPDEVRTGLWRPLRSLSFAIDYMLWALDPRAFHSVNVVWHMLNGCLVYLLVKLLLMRHIPLNEVSASWGAFIGALLFIAHPVQVEAVAWISSRGDLISSACWLSGFIAYVYARRGTLIDYRFAGMVILMYIAGLCAKASMFTFPLIMLVYDSLFPRKQPTTRRIDQVIIYGIIGCIAVLYLLIRIHFFGLLAQRAWWGGGWYPTALTMLSCAVQYLRLLIMPVALRIVYEPAVVYSFFTSAAMASAVLLIMLGCCVWWCAKRAPLVSFSVVWIAIALLPFSNILPLRSLMNERYLYCAVFGVSLLGAWLWQYCRAHYPRAQIISAIVFGVVLLLFSVQSFKATRYWLNDRALWENALRYEPKSYLVHSSLASVCMNRGAYTEAEYHINNALQYEPASIDALTNAAWLMLKKGDEPAAQAYINRARAIDPAHAAVLYTQALLHYRQGDYAAAVDWYRKACEESPDNDRYYLGLAQALKNDHHYAEALAANMTAVRLNPDNAMALNNIGTLYATAFSDPLSARDYFTRAIALAPESEAAALARENIAILDNFQRR